MIGVILAATFDNLPFNIAMILITIASSYAVIKYQVKDTKDDMKDLTKKVDSHKKEIDNKLDQEQYKREKLRNELVERVHAIDKKVTEIHTILTQK